MQINIQAPYNIYKGKSSEAGKTAQGSGSVPARETGRLDRDSITRGSTTMSDKQLLTLKSGVQSYVSAPAGNDRLASIREGIQSGSYHIPTAELVSAIMLDE